MTAEQRPVPRPLPQPNADDQEWWQGLKRRELLIQRCAQCGLLRHAPRPMCSECQSLDREWIKASGKGTIYSFIVVRHPVHPYFSDLPYNVVLVELDEGTRLVSNLLDVSVEDIFIGMPVEVTFEDVSDDIALPKFRRGDTTQE